MDGGCDSDVSRDPSGKIFPRDSMILNPPSNKIDERMKSLGMRILDHHYTIKRHPMVTNADPRRRKNMTGEA
jgi:hypothetical protein